MRTSFKWMRQRHGAFFSPAWAFSAECKRGHSFAGPEVQRFLASGQKIQWCEKMTEAKMAFQESNDLDYQTPTVKENRFRFFANPTALALE